MTNFFRCQRCGKQIPIRPEIVGQTVLCPGCMERVYVTEAKEPQSTPTPVQHLVESTTQPLTNLAGHPRASEKSGSGLPVGLIAACGGALLLLLVCLVVVAMNWPQPAEQQSAQAVSSVPSPPNDDPSFGAAPPPPPTAPEATFPSPTDSLP